MDSIAQKLIEFKRKYHLRQLYTGVILLLILFFGIFLLLNWLEYTFWFSPTIRRVLFFSFILLLIGLCYKLIAVPLWKILELSKRISDDEAAHEIGNFFPEIKDRLINAIQLSSITDSENQLLLAAIDKKEHQLKPINFSQAIDYKLVKKYLSIFSLVFFALLLVSFTKPDLVKDGTKRLINYNDHFVKAAPFQFELLNDSLSTYTGNDFMILLSINGESIPENVYLIDDQDLRMKLYGKNGLYEYNLVKLQEDKTFRFEAAGISSSTFEINVYDRPELVGMEITIIPPRYTGSEIESVFNNGNLIVLEGSDISWKFNTAYTNTLDFIIYDSIHLLSYPNENFALTKSITSPTFYDVILKNEFGRNASELTYEIEVIKDSYPQLKAQLLVDSVNYKHFGVLGNIADDYGFTDLKVIYSKQGQSEKELQIPFSSSLREQSFYQLLSFDSLSLQPGEKIEVQVIATDNDQINGFKSAKSGVFTFQLPTDDEIDEEINKKSQSVEKSLSATKNNSTDIKEKLEDLENRLKTGQEISWQEKKIIDDLLKDKEKMLKEISQLQQEHSQLNKAKDQFQENSESIKEKNEQLQDILDELLDKETLELYEKLKELLEENASPTETQKQLDKIQKNEKTLEKELERALELFKRLKLESELAQNLQKLDSLSNEQETLSKEDLNEEKQKDLNEEFQQFREKMDEIEKMNQELKNPEPIEDFELEERQIQKELDEILEEMSKERSDDANKVENTESEQSDAGSKSQSQKNTQQKQKNASQKMKSLSQKLSKMQAGMEMEMMQANLDQLRDIADNLVKLSFDQEDIMKELKTVNQSDPRFLELSQNQLKLKDDAKVIEDSLLSLASRVVQISSFVTREVEEINRNIEESLDQLKDRNRGRALSNQQFAMTSINNLALLLDNTMQQMQMAMAESMGQSKGNQKKPSKGLPDLSEMQDQLGGEIKKLEQSGKQGRELSEELAKLAAQQEMIRRQTEQLKEAQDGKPGGSKGGDNLEKAIRMMEQNEIDLVNKRLTRQLINRQKQIETRMLEAEKAERNQSEKEEREGEQAKYLPREIPPAFEEYIKVKQKEIELLKTIPLDLNPFYKKEVNDYFRRISSGENND